MKYPVLSCSPPYATLIALLLKRIETRGWATRYRGPMLIHQTAAPGPKGMTEAALWDMCLSDPFRAPLLAAGYGNPARLPRGAIVAVTELTDCLPIKIYSIGDSAINGTSYPLPPDPERAFGDYTIGRYAWLLSNIRALPTPIPARGMPGMWTWEGEL